MHRHLDAVTLPDGTVVWAASFAGDYVRDDPPDHGVYFDQRWSPPWSHELLDWPDFGVPADTDALVRTLEGALDRARRGERVEMGCLGGHGRTGTALACLAALTNGARDTGDAAEAGERIDPVDWVRQTYCSHAVETDAQAALARGLRGHGERG